jgi:hypothetical protein
LTEAARSSSSSTSSSNNKYWPALWNDNIPYNLYVLLFGAHVFDQSSIIEKGKPRQQERTLSFPTKIFVSFFFWHRLFVVLVIVCVLLMIDWWSRFVKCTALKKIDQRSFDSAYCVVNVIVSCFLTAFFFIARKCCSLSDHFFFFRQF